MTVDLSTTLLEFLRMQHKLQVGMKDKRDPMLLQGEERLHFLRWNVLALEDELHEMLGETGWKPWASSKHVHEVPALKEMIDAWHFFMNILMVLAPIATPARGATGDTETRDVESDLEALAVWFGQAYVAKNQVNLQRSLGGYDGISTKCPNCKRELSEVSSTQRYMRDGVEYCRMACASQVSQEIHAAARERMKRMGDQEKINPNTMINAPVQPGQPPQIDVHQVARELRESVHGYSPNVREEELTGAEVNRDIVHLDSSRFHGKAGKILASVAGTDEPVFIFRAKDLLSTMVIAHYAKLVDEYQGDDAEMAEGIHDGLEQFKAWQRANPDKVRLPD